MITRVLFSLRALILPIVGLMTIPAPLHAGEQDVAASVRGVVRVVLVASNGESSYYVGHGSGFAVSPTRILTNAHVVELLRTEKSLTLGVVPSEGKRSYGGKVIAYSPGNDLALVEITDGRLPALTFYAGAVTDGQHVVAIGYPGTVDRAQKLGIADIIAPLSPVKTSGNVSAGRASRDYDTILHTAPMAEGDSGGPLVDDCGRVLGVNNAVTNGDSSQFGFAVSNREVASFLRQAGVQFQRTIAPCRSIADLDAQEAERARQEQEKAEALAQAEAFANEKRLTEAKMAAQQDIIMAQQNMMALAAVLLGLAVVGIIFCARWQALGRKRAAIWAGVGAGVLAAGAIAAFLLRPSFDSLSEINTPISDGGDKAAGGSLATIASKGYNPVGNNLCRIDMQRSRVTVSETANVPLEWQDNGCVNGTTQYGRDGARWSRIFVPGTDPVISINSFDPATGRLQTDRYLAGDDVLSRARSLRAKFTFKGCSADPAQLDKLAEMQGQMRAILPPQPNERLVYSCQNAPKTEGASATP